MKEILFYGKISIVFNSVYKTFDSIYVARVRKCNPSILQKPRFKAAWRWRIQLNPGTAKRSRPKTIAAPESVGSISIAGYQKPILHSHSVLGVRRHDSCDASVFLPFFSASNPIASSGWIDFVWLSAGNANANNTVVSSRELQLAQVPDAGRTRTKRISPWQRHSRREDVNPRSVNTSKFS